MKLPKKRQKVSNIQRFPIGQSTLDPKEGENMGWAETKQPPQNGFSSRITGINEGKNYRGVYPPTTYPPSKSVPLVPIWAMNEKREERKLLDLPLWKYIQGGVKEELRPKQRLTCGGPGSKENVSI